MTPSRSVFLLLLALAAFLRGGHGGYNLLLDMEEFSNPDHKDLKGYCCDSTEFTSCPTAKCDFKFKLCIEPSQEGSPGIDICRTGWIDTQRVATDVQSFHFESGKYGAWCNPMLIRVPKPWQGFYFKIQALDDDSDIQKPDEAIDNLLLTFNGSWAVDKRHEVTLDHPREKVSTRPMPGPTETKFAFTVICDPSSPGPHCDGTTTTTTTTTASSASSTSSSATTITTTTDITTSSASTPKTSTTAITTSFPFVENCTLDIVFVLDSSQSVTEDGFPKIKKFAGAVVEEVSKRSGWPVGSKGMQYALVKFNTEAHAHLLFNQSTGMGAVLNAINDITYTLGVTNTYEGLYVTYSQVLRSGAGDRKFSPDIIILVTDGLYTAGTIPPGPMADLIRKETGAEIIAVGIKGLNGPYKQIFYDELLRITKEKDHIFNVTEYEGLFGIVDRLISTFNCSARPSTTTTGPGPTALTTTTATSSTKTTTTTSSTKTTTATSSIKTTAATSTSTTTPLTLPPTGSVTCAELHKQGVNASGMYELQVEIAGQVQRFKAYCDMDTDGGGWTVIQRQNSPNTLFNTNWTQYEQGFNDSIDLSGNLWLGNQYIHWLTQAQQMALRVDLKDCHNRWKYEHYPTFKVGDASSNYRLTVSEDGAVTGTAGNSLSYPDNGNFNQNGAEFSTTDRDNDKQPHVTCTKYFPGGWWYNACGTSNLNGFYYPDCAYTSAFYDGIFWFTWETGQYSARSVEMKIRRVDYLS